MLPLPLPLLVLLLLLKLLLLPLANAESWPRSLACAAPKLDAVEVLRTRGVFVVGVRSVATDVDRAMRPENDFATSSAAPGATSIAPRTGEGSAFAMEATHLRSATGDRSTARGNEVDSGMARRGPERACECESLLSCEAFAAVRCLTLFPPLKVGVAGSW